MSSDASAAASWGTYAAGDDDDDGNEPMDLLNDDGDALHPLVSFALRNEVFHRCDADVDGALSDADLQHLARWCNAGDDGHREFSADELEQIHDTFACDDLGRLTVDGLEDMYALQTSADTGATLADLAKLGYVCTADAKTNVLAKLCLYAVDCRAAEIVFSLASPQNAERAAVADSMADSTPTIALLPGAGGKLPVILLRSIDEFFRKCDSKAPFAGQRIPVLHPGPKGSTMFKLEYAVVRKPAILHQPSDWLLQCESAHVGIVDAVSKGGTSTATQLTIDQFLAAFSAERDRASSVAASTTLPGGFASTEAALDALSARLSNMRTLLIENQSLPSRDVAAAQRDCDKLAADILSAKERWQPRKKFSFRSRQASGQRAEEQVQQDVQDTTLPEDAKRTSSTEAAMEGAAANALSDAAETLQGASGQTFNFCSGSQPPRRFIGLSDCVVYAPPMTGSIYVEDCRRCNFFFAAQQLRIHTTLDSDFHLFVKSGPIIEDCSNVRFGPYTLRYPSLHVALEEKGFLPQHAEGGESNAFAEVNDFKWLRAQHSPHWSILDGSTDVVTIEDTC